MPRQKTFDVVRSRMAKVGDHDAVRRVCVEAPVAFEYNGIGYAAMMATPADLEAFAIGFTLGEGLDTNAAEIEDIAVHELGGG